MEASEETVRRVRQEPQQWADDVHAALLRQLSPPMSRQPIAGGRMNLVRSWAGVEEGRPVLHVSYGHPSWSFTAGLRRYLDDLDHHPLQVPGSEPDYDPAEDLAGYVITCDIEESLGTELGSVVPDGHGVWWRGDAPLPGDESRRDAAPTTSQRRWWRR